MPHLVTIEEVSAYTNIDFRGARSQTATPELRQAYKRHYQQMRRRKNALRSPPPSLDDQFADEEIRLTEPLKALHAAQLEHARIAQAISLAPPGPAYTALLRRSRASWTTVQQARINLGLTADFPTEARPGASHRAPYRKTVSP